MNNVVENAFYRQDITVPLEAIDENGHLNNVTYIQWMQDIAIAHANHTSCTAATAKTGATWIARSHKIEYLRPAFEGEQLVLFTWIASIRRARSQRKYQFLRLSDQALIAIGETDWVFVNRETGKPQTIPPIVTSAFEIISDERSLTLKSTILK
ncbi:MAG: acyl-CoA thioesterase [Phormidesmis sp.]